MYIEDFIASLIVGLVIFFIATPLIYVLLVNFC
jgi:hypothetical protein